MIDPTCPSTAGTSHGPLARLAAWTMNHKRIVLGGWLVALVLATAASHKAGTHFVNNLSLAGTDSQRASDLLKRDFPARSGDLDQIVVHTNDGSVRDPAVRARLQPVLVRVGRLPHVSAVQSPYGAAASGAVSADGHTAFATVTFDDLPERLPRAAVERVISVARSARSNEVQVELGGRAIEEAHRPSLGAATAIGLMAAIVVLLVTFGSVLAAGVPILTALLGLGTALGLIGLLSRTIDTPDFSTQLAALLGLGVGIDYALFIVTRFRENLHAGQDMQGSITAAMDTAGRAVLFAGITVIIALLGMVVLGISLLDAAALASALSVALTMLAALTVMPVLLSRFGERIGRRARAPKRGYRQAGWPRWAALVSRHPWVSLVAGLAIMLVLAVPALSLRLGQSDAGNDPTSLTSRRAYDLLTDGFGKGFNGPLQVVAQLPHAGDSPALAQISSAVSRTPGVKSVSAPTLSPSGTTAVYQAFPRTAPQSKATTDLVNRLRHDRLPSVAQRTGARLLVGGSTASGIDFAHVVGQKLAVFIAAVIILAGLLLVTVFRSVAIPIQAAVMNLLSVGASLGVVVAVFQYGWLGGLFNVKSGPIEAFIPVFLFAIVFGLSMDYEVFLISRIHEAWLRRRDPTAAMVEGVGSTGRVVTAAATIMVCVFISFVVGDQRVVKLFGLSLASAVFLDAFVVRSLLLPSVLTLLGRRTWALPGALERRLPRLAIEPTIRGAAAPLVPEALEEAS
ncbi:MAG TPA: MMPL family transporter [Thermoleophilaceae bacterium]|nr:MMPL family transporter [Thermoleophilaceae bacterium]